MLIPASQEAETGVSAASSQLGLQTETRSERKQNRAGRVCSSAAESLTGIRQAWAQAPRLEKEGKETRTAHSLPTACRKTTQPQNHSFFPQFACGPGHSLTDPVCRTHRNNRLKLEVIYFISWDYKFNSQTRGQHFSLTRGP